MSDQLEPPPTPSAGERAASIGRAVIADVPIPGTGTAVEILSQVFGISYERRRDAWAQRLRDLVNELQERMTDADEILERPDFVSAVHAASRIAVGEHLEDKLDMLQAVLRHCALEPPSRRVDLTTMRFLRYVDELEPEHVATLHRCTMRVLISGKVVGGNPDDQRIVDTVAALPARHLLVRDLEQRTLLDGTDPQPPSGELAADLLRRDIRAGDAFRVKPGLGNAKVTGHGLAFLEWLDVV